MKVRTSLIVIVLMLMTMGCASFAFGAVSEEEASKLGGPVLTGIGAERAGNKDGSIPAWSSVPISIPKEYKKGSGLYVDPFADEKPLFSISQKNMAQYADKLAVGVKTLMKKYPDYRIDVYPTHRTMVYPQWVYDNTKRNATACQTAKDGRMVMGKGCWGGSPFPIPKTGAELIWNHQLGFAAPEACTVQYENYNITSTGKASVATHALWINDLVWNDPGNDSDNKFALHRFNFIGPPRKNGEILLGAYPKDWAVGSVIWQYLPGQRRLRLAPDICCDTPNAGTAGASVYDDTMIFNGDPGRFNWKLIGKKELYIPYNTYKFIFYRGPVEKALLKHYVNPDLLRWELHRVWVVEGTLKPGKRHVYSKRIMYVDEDSFTGAMSESYDKHGSLYRLAVAFKTYSYDVQVEYTEALAFYDLISNSYAAYMWPRLSSGIQYMKFFPASYFTPDSLAGGGLR